MSMIETGRTAGLENRKTANEVTEMQQDSLGLQAGVVP